MRLSLTAVPPSRARRGRVAEPRLAAPAGFAAGMMQRASRVSAFASGPQVRRGIIISIAFHAFAGLLYVAWPAMFGRTAPTTPETPAEIDLVIGTNATKKTPQPEQQQPPETAAPPPGIADAEPAELAQIPDAAPATAESAPAPAPPVPAPPDPAAPPIPAKPPAAPTSVASAATAAKPRTPAPPAKQTSAPTPVDAPGRPPTEPVPMPEIRLDDGISAPPAEILDPNGRIRAAESDVGNTAPEYPAEASRRHETGTVVLRLHVDSQGNVVHIDMIRSSGFASLDRASRERLSTWHFHPALIDGQPVADVVEQTLNFVDK